MQRSVEIEQTILRNNKLGDLCVTFESEAPMCFSDWSPVFVKFQVSMPIGKQNSAIKFYFYKRIYAIKFYSILGLFKGKVSNI